jgi:carboxypeptidase family protein/TonB-dependent receptor-like protein
MNHRLVSEPLRSGLKCAVLKTVWVSILLAVATSLALAQTEASVSGTVTDPSAAHVVNATVTALNQATGVTTPAVTNEAGVYTMPQLPPGKYNFTAEHPGFRKSVISDVELQVGTVMTLNMGLELGQTTETVEVQAMATEVNATSASVGNVVDSKRLIDLPLNGRSAYDLLLTQPGVQEGTNFYLNGAQGASVNFTIDGVTAMDNLHQSAFYLYSNVVSVDRAEEFRVVTSPADAEYGRGSGQVQMVTRAGSNRFAGSAYYELRNAELNANNFFNNLAGSNPNGTPLEPRSQLKQNNYGVRFGGPVKKNKMFFNGIYEPYKQRNFTTVNQTVYTPTALDGIFRFYPGVPDGNAQSAVPTVNLAGQPVQPAGATGPLQSVSVLGRDPARLVPDPTGVMAHVLSYLPLPNNYLVGDGLNTAGFTWNYPTPVNFELYEGRIDYNFDDKERLAITLSQQSYHSFNVATPPPYPLVPGQADPTETTTYTAALTSILRADLLNEARMGIFRTRTIVETPYGGTSEASKSLLPVIDGTPTLIYPAALGTPFTGPYGNLGIPGNYLNPTYQYGDNLTWIKGKHSFKGGVQLRFISLAGFDFGASNLPIAVLGAPPLSPINNISTGNAIPGIGQNATAAASLLEVLTGATLEATQTNISPGGTNPKFLVGQQPYHDFHQNEFDWFFKDDYKVTPSLTLNLGVRWELYLPPVEVQGKGVAPVGGSAGLFGISGTNMSSLFNPDATGGSPTVIQPIGPGTPNPNTQFYHTDYKNFAPALGLAWALPGDGFWRHLSGGKDKMTIRIGYGIGYQRLPMGIINTVSGAEPGYTEVDTSFASTNLSNITVPVQPAGVPLAPVPLTGTGSHTQTVYAYDTNLRTPYTQNYNFTITRALARDLTFDLAFVGSKSSELVRTVNVNEVNIYENGLLNAFNTVLAGGDSPLIDQIFSNSYAAVAAAGGGSNYVRTNSATNVFLANNNPGGLANYINTTTALSGSAGGLLKNAGLPLNFIVVNPQFLNAYLTGNFGNSTYNSLQVQVVKRFSHGFNLQSSYVWSKNLGDDEGDFGTQTVAGATADSYRTLRNESLDKRPLSFDYESVFKINGLYELPFGPNKPFLHSTNGFLSRVFGGWQLGAISLMYSGQPISLVAQDTINFTTVSATSASGSSSSSAAFTPNILGSLPAAGVTKTGNGVVYFPGLTQIVDPSIANINSATLRALSTLRAIAGPNGQPLFVNPLPGQMGDMGLGELRGPGAKQVNVNLIKRIRINERFTFQLGATAENLTNTPIFANPNTNINSTAFGRITATAGTNPSRLIVLQGRVFF